MAVPKRGELADRRKNMKNTNINILGNQSERSLYLAMKYDYEHNQLSGYKLKKFLSLRDKYDE